jgi:hypothetical protein
MELLDWVASPRVAVIIIAAVMTAFDFTSHGGKLRCRWGDLGCWDGIELPACSDLRLTRTL